MNNDATQGNEVDIYKRPIPNIEKLRAIAARIVLESGSDENPIELLNTLIRADGKLDLFRARFGANGTTLSASAMQLAQDSARNANHRRTLARNLDKANNTKRPAHVEAHHIVGAHDPRAKDSRAILFQKSIGINDADNGNYQPASDKHPVPGLDGASIHRNIHTALYHLNVYKRLATVEDQNQVHIRGTLREIKAELNAGTFIY